MPIQLRDIEYFAKIAAHRNIGRAADALGLSQPALSMSLRRLEKSIGTKLVQRTPKGVDLTAVGSALLNHVRRLRLSLDDLEREAGDLARGTSGEVRIGAGPGFAEYLLPQASAELFRTAPGVSLQLEVEDLGKLMPLLRAGTLDLVISGISDAPSHGLSQEHLLDDDFVVTAAARHRLAGKKHLTLKEVANERWAMAAANTLPWQQLLQAFARHRLPPPHVAMLSNSALVRLQTVAESDLLNLSSTRFLRQSGLRGRLTVLTIAELAWTRRIGVTYRADGYLSPAARRFIDILKARARIIASESARPPLRGFRETDPRGL